MFFLATHHHPITCNDSLQVVSELMQMGSSTVGACGDVSRNVMCTPAPKVSKPYQYAREYSKLLAELLKPSSTAFTELWLGDEKVAGLEYWRKDIDEEKVKAAFEYDSGRGVMVDDPTEPLYGKQYLPRKFKCAVTVPGDNSLDMYITDIGLVVITDPVTEELLGFNVMVREKREPILGGGRDPLSLPSISSIPTIMCYRVCHRRHRPPPPPLPPSSLCVV
jgi:sulfite reductase (ferredoxin)